MLRRDAQPAYARIGTGPRVRAELPAVDAVDPHPTVTQLLGIEPGQPVDGRPIEALLAAPAR